MAQEVTIIPWKKTPTERENGPWRISAGSFVPATEFETYTSLFVHFGPKSWAGNHRHVQKEMLICITGEIYLLWRDEKGEKHEEKMLPKDGSLQAFLIDSSVPHMMKNRSEAEFGTVQVWYGVEEPEVLEGIESLL